MTPVKVLATSLIQAWDWWVWGVQGGITRQAAVCQQQGSGSGSDSRSPLSGLHRRGK
jgi:hypothetical protein